MKQQNYTRRFLSVIFFWPCALMAQVDTTDAGYQLGYKIGSWLPLIFLTGLFIFMLVMARKRSEKNDQ